MAEIDHEAYFAAARAAVDKLTSMFGVNAEPFTALVKLKAALDHAKRPEGITKGDLHLCICGMYAELEEIFDEDDGENVVTFADLLAGCPEVAKPLEMVVARTLAKSGAEFSTIEWTGKKIRRSFAKN